MRSCGHHGKRERDLGICPHRLSQQRKALRYPADRPAGAYVRHRKNRDGQIDLLATLLKQDLEQGRGVALLDPHGDLVERVRQWIPESRKGDLVYFNVPDATRVLGFNPLETVPPLNRPLAASGLIEVFKNWADSWGPRLEYILRNALLTLLDQPKRRSPTCCDSSTTRSTGETRAMRCWNPQVRDFWLREFENYPKTFRLEAIAPIQNKVGAFLRTQC